MSRNQKLKMNEIGDEFTCVDKLIGISEGALAYLTFYVLNECTYAKFKIKVFEQLKIKMKTRFNTFI